MNMVYVKDCPLGVRGLPVKRFYIDGVPQEYCLGWYDHENERIQKECKECKDYVNGKQCCKDFREARKRGTKRGIQNKK